MFLNMTLKKNPMLIKAAFDLHRSGEITPDTYVLDIDAIRNNAVCLKEAASKYNIALFMMTKQFGRNPYIAKAIEEQGIAKAVAVDPWEAITLAEAGIKLGNVGHLVQIPNSMIEKIMKYEPEVITVFTFEKAEQISKVAIKLGKVQDILLKVAGNNDVVYEGQKGGIKEEDLIKNAEKIETLPGVKIVGVTSFPCFLYNDSQNKIVPTENLYTVNRCVDQLRAIGIDVKHVNTPSANSSDTMSLISKYKSTHAEPGHAFLGTTPFHAYNDLKEQPAVVYVSEISHCYDNKAYVYGGGYYRRACAKNVIVGKKLEDMVDNMLSIDKLSPNAIDYYGTLEIEDKNIEVGDTVIYAFRTQIFVTRSRVAIVEGIQNGNPQLVGIYDSLGKKVV